MADCNLILVLLLSNLFRTICRIREDKLFPAYPAAILPPDTGKAKWLEA